MARPDIETKLGDTLPAQRCFLEYADGSPINLADSTVQVIVASLDGTVMIDRAAAVIDAETGEIVFSFLADDFDKPGDYMLEFRVTSPTGIVTVPKRGYYTVQIGASLG